MKRLALMLLASVFLSSAHAADFQIAHVEPMHWWVGMHDPQLQVMVHGENIASLKPEVNYPGVKLVRVDRTDNKNYVFLNFQIAPSARAGAFDIAFKRGGATLASTRYRLEQRRQGSAQRKSFSAGDAIYLLMPDRFANGSAANDTLPGMVEPADRANPVARHGGDLAGMTAHLDYIKQLGFTMVWPTPLLENNQQAYSYHGYALTDFYRVDPRFGNNDDYRRYVAAANGLGMGVIHDVVLNHIGNGHWWMKDMPAVDWLNVPATRALTNNQHSTVHDIHAAPEDRALFQDGWFVDSMPDMNQRNPLVARYLIQNTIWWVEYANLSGIREDTFSYADSRFLSAWCKAVLAEYPNLNIVGEEMDAQPQLVAYWQKGARNRDGYDSGLPSVMDFPLVEALPATLNNSEQGWDGFHKLYDMIANDFLYPDPMNLLVFVDNHDRSRMLPLVHGNVDLLKTALLFTATTRGIPQFFYGTEVLTSSPVERDDGRLRADMPGGWEGDHVNAFTGAGLTAQQTDMQAFTRKLFNWRKGSAAIAGGKLTHFIPQDGCYVYFRYDGAHTVMVVLNKNASPATLDLTRFKSMIKQAARGRNVLTDETVSLRAPLAMKPMTSLAIEW
ncbi:glycoside hydrolase family 13 protein [Massilia sp. TSP1-1-2]|uniref:glycoside hydrolase family 13 protein n=1 Tax=Massilia sp. TSP1-1-2 TaxID=2804649 RepID=UPI003CF2A608